MPENDNGKEYNYFNSAGLHYEAEEVRRCISSEKIESDYVSHNDSITISKISDEIRKQIGVHYSEDDEEF